MNPTLPHLITAMLRREFYPAGPADVALRQTHISYVFLAGSHVYKVKKAVKFPFVDYSTLAQRRHFCEEEVRLNRRLAPATYLDVVRICLTDQGNFFLEENAFAKGDAVEYAVKMRRLPEELLLSSLVRQKSAQTSHLVAIAEKIAAFHERASQQKARAHGSAAAIATNLRDNFDETRRFIDHTISRHSYETIQDYSKTFLKEHKMLMAQRAESGRVREGHGDLRAEHICLIDDIQIFDCVEFDEGLRYNDVASEIGFLAMDLDFLDEPNLAAALESAYATVAQDRNLRALLPFYKCYRAYVRGKVESLKSAEREVADGERRESALRALRYFYLSSRYARGGSNPMLLIVCGLVGTGKSTVAWLLSALTGLPVFSSDSIRKELAGAAPSSHDEADYQSGIYTAEFTQRTYEKLLAVAHDRFAAGAGVIIDATMGEEPYRARFVDLANRFRMPVLFVECQAGEATIEKRLREREKDRNAISDATWEIYQRMSKEFPPFSLPESCHMKIDTENDLVPGLSKIEERF
jgi:uncharacterized protein